MQVLANNAPVVAPGTVLAAVLAALDQAGVYHPAAEAAPRALLWPDGAGQWGPVIARLRPHRPVLTLGDYDEATRTGPAIWIRAALAALPAAPLPIIYLPGIRKEVFRAVETAPAAIQPLLYL